MGARTLEECKTYYEGRVFKTNKCGDIVVINYFNAFKQAKGSYIKEVANIWKDKIDTRVYEALMNYQVEIID